MAHVSHGLPAHDLLLLGERPGLRQRALRDLLQAGWVQPLDRTIRQGSPTKLRVGSAKTSLLRCFFNFWAPDKGSSAFLPREAFWQVFAFCGADASQRFGHRNGTLARIQQTH